jgi:Fe-S cluster assembly protein SufD
MEETLGKERYLSLFDRFEKNGAGTGPSWIREVRRSAISCFADLGFPSTRNEDWKYTSVTPLAQVPFETKVPPASTISGDIVAPLSFTDPAYNRVVFVNGVFSPELSALRGIASGIQVGSLAEALHDDAAKVEPYLARHARYQNHSFVALNTAFIEDGAFVFVPEGLVLEEPLYLVFVSTTEGQPTVCHPRNLVVLGNASQARIVESYVGVGSGIYFANAVTEIVAGDGAVVDHYRLQRETDQGFHVGALAVHLSRHSNFTTHSLTLGGSLVRNDVHAVLDGEGIECVLNGLYLVDGQRHVDNHTHIEHVKPRSSSRELYKGVLDGKARGVFNGKILVHKAAQKTDAKQTNRNLLLSPDAVVNTKPQLEIYTDDVKCAHGSTIGQLDLDALFYLRSRGIDEESARSLLCYAFASDIVRRIKIGPMRARLDQYLTSKFRRT